MYTIIVSLTLTFEGTLGVCMVEIAIEQGQVLGGQSLPADMMSARCGLLDCDS